MAVRANLSVEDVLQILPAEDTEDDGQNISEASHSDDEIDFQPVWEVSEPLDLVEQDTNVGRTGEKSQPSVFCISTSIISILIFCHFETPPTA